MPAKKIRFFSISVKNTNTQYTTKYPNHQNANTVMEISASTYSDAYWRDAIRVFCLYGGGGNDLNYLIISGSPGCDIVQEWLDHA